MRSKHPLTNEAAQGGIGFRTTAASAGSRGQANAGALPAAGSQHHNRLWCLREPGFGSAGSDTFDETESNRRSVLRRIGGFGAGEWANGDSAGARARGVVTESKGLGKFKGQAVLAIRLDSVSADGRTYQVRTSHVERVEQGKGKRSAVIDGWRRGPWSADWRPCRRRQRSPDWGPARRRWWCSRERVYRE